MNVLTRLLGAAILLVFFSIGGRIFGEHLSYGQFVTIYMVAYLICALEDVDKND